MKAAELIKYLQRFNPKSDVLITPTDEKKRCFYHNEGIIAITDPEPGYPALFVMMGSPEPFGDRVEVVDEK